MSQLYPLPSISEADDADEIESRKIDATIQAIMDGATLKELQGIPDHVMDTIYAHGYNFYQKGMLNEAQTFFKFLCTYDTFNSSYYLGLGAVHHQKKNYVEAVAMYQLAFLVDDQNYPAMLYAGQCHLVLKNKDRAQQLFATIAASKASDQLRSQAQAYLNALRQAQPEGVTHA